MGRLPKRIRLTAMTRLLAQLGRAVPEFRAKTARKMTGTLKAGRERDLQNRSFRLFEQSVTGASQPAP